MPREDEGRDLQSEECQRLPANHQMLEERQDTDCPHHPQKGTNRADILILNFQPAELGEKNQSLVCCNFYGSLKQT